MIKCSKCNKFLVIGKFYTVRTSYKGSKVTRRRSECRDCTLKSNTLWRMKNKAYHIKYRKAYYSKNKIKLRPFKKDSYLMINYGISKERYEEIMKSQKFKCAICFKDLLSTIPHIDHNHKTGKLRDILCFNCNLGLGYFKDDIEKMELAIKYLKKHDGR